MHPECFNKDFLKVLETDADPFGFENLFYITRQEDSKKLNEHKKPCVIISASGMMEAGRIKHHLANNISDPKNTVLVVGYCAPTTLGARIVRGEKEVSIHGTVYKVNADIRKIESFSGHGDYQEMIDFLNCQDKNRLEKTFIVHGEYETQKKYVSDLNDEVIKTLKYRQEVRNMNYDPPFRGMIIVFILMFIPSFLKFSQETEYHGSRCLDFKFEDPAKVACIYADELPPSEKYMSINFRGNLNNCRKKFEASGKGRVAFLGGSITWNPGWRDMVCSYLHEKFPATEFDFINAGIPSLGSVPGSMRLDRDVLSKGTIDLLFEEAAVNDATNGVPAIQQIRGMEGIINHAIRSNPDIDIVMLYFADQDKLADYNNGKTPEVIQQHEKVAEYYSITSINFAKEVNDRVLNGEFTWRDDFKDLHPSEFGQKLYFRTIKHLFEVSWEKPAEGSIMPKQLPGQQLDQFSYVNGHIVSVDNAKDLHGWKIIERWNPDNVPGREGFSDDRILEGKEPGASLKFNFKGTAVGIFVTSGPDAGFIEFSIDGSEFKSVDQFTQWSNQLHLPWLIMLDDELREGKHKLILRILTEKNKESTGNACRIHYFVVN